MNQLTDMVRCADIAAALGITARAVNLRATKEKWCADVLNKRGDREYALKNLPADVQVVLVEKMDVGPETIPELSPEAALSAARKLDTDIYKGIASTVPTSWSADTAIGKDVIRDPRVAKWVQIIQEAQAVPRGWKKRAWVEAVAIKYDTTHQTIYRNIKVYKERGFTGLYHTKSTRGEPKAWTPEALDWWLGLYLKREHRKIAKDALYALLREEAARRGWRVGGYESALWWLKKRACPQLLALQRGGLRALDNTLPPVLRDYSDLNPFEILVGDQHRFDYWVLDDESGEIIRPEGYFWQDLRTRCFYGGALDRKYDGYLIGLALRMGLKIFGAFGSIYTDNGKPELSRYIMGVMKDMRAIGLGIEREIDVPLDIVADAEECNPCALLPGTHKKAIVRNAKAKMIEGTFNVLEAILRDHMRVPGYVKKLGGSGEENEIDQKEVERLARAGKLLTFWEFSARVMDAMDYYNKQKSHRGVLKEWAWRPKPKAAAPFDCLMACHGKGWRPGRISDEAVDMIFLPRENRIVDRGRVLLRGETYEHETLIPRHKDRVEIRFDPMDPDYALCFDDQGGFICKADPVEYSSMKDATLAARKIEEKRRRRKGFILEYRKLTSAIPDFCEYSRTPAIERAALALKKEARRETVTQIELYAERTPAELAAEVARIDEAKAATERPLFSNQVDRYQWIIDRQAEGSAVAEADQVFLREYEARMDRDTLSYWTTYKEAIGGTA